MHDTLLRNFELTDLEYFKATVYRLFLLYVGPYFFKNILPSDIFQHFILLHFATYIFCSDPFHHLYKEADCALKKFVIGMVKNFGRHSITYNVHMLIHIYEFVLLHGRLDNFSTFPFENYLNIVKRRSKKTSKPFSYLTNQLMIIRSFNVSNPEKSLFYLSNFLNNCCIVEKNCFNSNGA